MVKKEDTTKPAAKKPAAHKPAVSAAKKPKAPAKAPAKKKAEPVEVAAKQAAPAPVATASAEISVNKPVISGGRYIFATGRRKTAIANVRLFSGKGENSINRKPFEQYFFHSSTRDSALKPLQVSGLANDFHFYATINGGGIIAQAIALQHGIAQALASMSPEMHAQLKKNDFLTRDDRKKERKKPGLKRARRSPQWAKR